MSRIVRLSILCALALVLGCSAADEPADSGGPERQEPAQPRIVVPEYQVVDTLTLMTGGIGGDVVATSLSRDTPPEMFAAHPPIPVAHPSIEPP